MYDPLGLSGPVVIPAKNSFKSLVIGWDDELPEALRLKWCNWCAELPLLSQFAFKRSCNLHFNGTLEIHYFSDGSETAYGSIAYARSIFRTGKIVCTPLVSKSRLTPLNSSTYMTVPRIELNAAKLSVILKQIIHKVLSFRIDKELFWTASTIVLQYFNSSDRRFTRFVTNRVSFILSNTQAHEWQYVPSQSNPADYTSRGVSVPKLLSLRDWTESPSFLWKPENEWPFQDKIVKTPDENLELCKSSLCNTVLVDDTTPTDKLLKSCSN